MLRFEWDERKNKGNRIKHGVWFEEAQVAFDDPQSRLFSDPEHSQEEPRFILMGASSATPAPGRRPLLQRIRFHDSHYFRAKSHQEGA